jgi:hypothetical protein
MINNGTKKSKERKKKSKQLGGTLPVSDQISSLDKFRASLCCLLGRRTE